MINIFVYVKDLYYLCTVKLRKKPQYYKFFCNYTAK